MREPDLQAFLDVLDAGLSRGRPDAVATAFLARLSERLARPGTDAGTEPADLPVVAQLPDALRLAAGAEAVAEVAAALALLAPRLRWTRRPTGGPGASASWPDGHANAVIVGQGGIEARDDVTVGVSLLAPDVRYPDHDHPPEELYLILTRGRFQHGDDPWVDLGPGERFHNPPGIRHAMASGPEPLLAVWTLVA